MGVQFVTAIRQVEKQVLLIVVGTKPARFLLYGVYLKTKSKVSGTAYSNKSNQALMIKFENNAEINHIGLRSIIKHAHVVLLLKRLICSRATLFATALFRTFIG